MIDLNQIIQQAWEQASQNEFFQGGFLLGALAWIGMQLKNIPLSIWSRIRRQIRYVMYFDNTSEMYSAFAEWLLEEYPATYKNVEASLLKHHKDKKITYLKMVTQYNDFNFLWYKRRLIFISKTKVTVENANSPFNRFIETYSISGFFARKAINSLVDLSITRWQARHSDVVGIYVVLMSTDGQETGKYLDCYKKMDDIFLANKQELLDDLDNFMSKQPTYRDLGIKFKRGYLLYGPPGTGKTTLAFAVADMYDMPIHYINPQSFHDDIAFEDFISGVRPWSMILIEDVDIFWTNRDKANYDVGVSFQSLLNVLDGLHSPNNVLIFMTTNKQDSFDEAFLRKGRLDFKLLVDHPGKPEVEAFISRYYGKDTKLKKYIGGKPMVDIQDLCIKNDYLTVLNTLENE